MSPLQIQDRLDELAATIRLLRGRVLDLERQAGDLAAGDKASVNAGAEAFMCKARLDAALHDYFDVSERARDRQCPIHGEANPHLHACPDCSRIYERDESRVQLKSA